MNIHADKPKENAVSIQRQESQSMVNPNFQKKSNSKSIFQFKDNRSNSTKQLKIQEIANNSRQVDRTTQLQSAANNYSAGQQPSIHKTIPTTKQEENKTGMPDNLKSGIENLSGLDMSDVKVHYNSPQPAQLQAHAFAQGNQIHIASGQERHLPHEAWHVVQQKQGRVSPTKQLKGKVNINDNVGLEKEADIMGEKATSLEYQEQSNNRTSQLKHKSTKLSSSVHQLLRDDQYDELTSLFNPSISYEEFHKGQHDFQDRYKLTIKDQAGPKGFTTFGMEYEMIPYKNENPIANTAHIKLAEGISMPYKDYPEVLVTDSDNVIEYVTPVFVLPFEGAPGQITGYIAIIRNLLTKFRGKVESQKHATLKDLVTKPPFAFIPWQIVNSLNISFREIDEKTNIDKLATATGWGRDEIASTALGYDSGAVKNPKHQELKKEALGSAMQSTVLLPLDLVSKLVHRNIETSKPKEAGSIATKKKAQGREKRAAKPTGIVEVLVHELEQNIRGLASNPDLHSLIYLFCQRLSLILEAPHAVKFQAYYQAQRFQPGVNPVPGTAEAAPVGAAQGPELDDALLAKYTEEEKEYQVHAKAKTLSEIPNNFHNAHSNIKDRLSIWTRVHLDDVIRQIGRILGKDMGHFIEPVMRFLAEQPEGRSVMEKMQTIIYSDMSEPFTEHNPVHFLDENPEYFDLRQDTLRNIVEIEGRPWVLVELRDLKEDTLKKLYELGGL